MDYPENPPSAARGGRPSTEKNALPGGRSNSNRNTASDPHVVNPVNVTPSIVQKATAILKDEVNGRTSRSTEEIGKPLQWEPADLKSPLKEWPKYASRLGDTLVQANENRTELPTQLASQTPSIGELPKGDSFPNFFILKPPPLVTPGQARQIDVTLINDDPKETVEYTLNATDLLGRPGERIPAEYIQMSPNPVRIPPGGTADVQIEIRVPIGTQPGNYKGLLQIDDISQEHAMLQLSVGP